VYTIVTEPPGSEVFIDGKSRGVTDEKGTLAIKTLPKGKASSDRKHEGYKDNDQFVTSAPGENQRVELEKEVLTLIVKTPPNCGVWVDGENRGKTDEAGKLAVPNLTYGSHSIIVKDVDMPKAQRAMCWLPTTLSWRSNPMSILMAGHPKIR